MPAFMHPAFATAEVLPFFSLLDALASPQQQQRQQHCQRRANNACARPTRTFQPRFDVREDATAFHLIGELPAVAQKDITVEFTDHNTLVIRGRSERDSSSSSASASAAVQEQQPEQQATPEVETEQLVDDAASTKVASYHSATVEDEDDFVDAGASSDTEKGDLLTPAASAPAPVAVAATTPTTTTTTTAPQVPEAKYLIVERAVGSFSRSFKFPGRVDQEGVNASLKDGVLTVVVPKRAEEKRRISIE